MQKLVTVLISQSGWKTSEELLNHIVSITVYSSLIFGGRGSCMQIIFTTTSHKYSTELMSGECGDHSIHQKFSKCSLIQFRTTWAINDDPLSWNNQSWIYENSHEIVHPSFSYLHQIKFCINLTKLLLTQDKISKNKNNEVYCKHILLIYRFDVFNMPASCYEFHQI